MAKPAMGDEFGDAGKVHWNEPGLRGMWEEVTSLLRPEAIVKWMALVALLSTVSACERKKESSVADSEQASGGVSATGGAPSAPVNSPSCGGETLTDEGVGKIRIGESVESVRHDCTVVRDTTELGGEGMPTRMVSVLFPRDTVDVEIVDDKVWRVAIDSRHFSTTDSLHVGTSLAQLLRLRAPQGMTGEGALFVMSPDHCGLSFRLSDNGSPVLRDPSPAELSRLPAATRVSNILIVGCHK
jgi:hypothetical protein